MHQVFKEMNSPSSFSKRKPGTAQVPWAVAEQQQCHTCTSFCVSWPEPRAPRVHTCCWRVLSSMCPAHGLHKLCLYILSRHQAEFHFPACTYFFFPKMPANEIAAQWHAVFSPDIGCSCEKEMNIGEQHLCNMETQQSHKCCWETLGGLKKWNLA